MDVRAKQRLCLLACPSNSNWLWRRFRPTLSQPLGIFFLNPEVIFMANNKDLIHYFRGANEREAEERIFAEFNRAYQKNNCPKGMALFSHNADGISALSISAASVPFCAELLKLDEWSEVTELFGYRVCVAGDKLAALG